MADLYWNLAPTRTTGPGSAAGGGGVESGVGGLAADGGVTLGAGAAGHAATSRRAQPAAESVTVTAIARLRHRVRSEAFDGRCVLILMGCRLCRNRTAKSCPTGLTAAGMAHRVRWRSHRPSRDDLVTRRHLLHGGALDVIR